MNNSATGAAAMYLSSFVVGRDFRRDGCVYQSHPKVFLTRLELQLFQICLTCSSLSQQDVELVIHKGGLKVSLLTVFSLDFQLFEELGLLLFLSLQRLEFSFKIVDGFGCSRTNDRGFQPLADLVVFDFPQFVVFGH